MASRSTGVYLCERSVDRVATSACEAREQLAIVPVGGRLAQQPEVAIRGGDELVGRGRAGTAQRLVERAPADPAMPGLEDLAHEVDAAFDRLDDGLRGVEPECQLARQEALDLLEGRGE